MAYQDEEHRDEVYQDKANQDKANQNVDIKAGDTVQARIRGRREVHLDRIRGCMLGGAAGDALGYAIEFDREGRIFSRYGKTGITEYQLDQKSGKALVSDDTQMALFTANGLLVGDTRGALRGIRGSAAGCVMDAYLDWLRTQEISYQKSREPGYEARSWLCDVPELYDCRAPGLTCLSALRERRESLKYKTAVRMNGCGGNRINCQNKWVYGLRKATP